MKKFYEKIYTSKTVTVSDANLGKNKKTFRKKLKTWIIRRMRKNLHDLEH
jgi:hypothetical protein